MQIVLFKIRREKRLLDFRNDNKSFPSYLKDVSLKICAYKDIINCHSAIFLHVSKGRLQLWFRSGL